MFPVMMPLIYIKTKLTCHLCYFDGFIFNFSQSSLVILDRKLCGLEKEALVSPCVLLMVQKVYECVSGAGVLVATPCCSPDGSKALPPQQRSQQPASTAGEETEGGERITMLTVLRHGDRLCKPAENG